MMRLTTTANYRWWHALGRWGACVAAAAGLLFAPGSVAQQPQAAPATEQMLALPPDADARQRSDTGSVQFIGTATVIIRYRGLTILTDPNFLHKGEHVHLGYGLRSKRLTDPAIAFDKLPPIDLVLLSHFHEDHFDKLVQQRLPRDVPIVSTVQAGVPLAELGFTRRYALATWETLRVVKGDAEVKITAMPGRHGAPGVNVLLPAVMGSMLDFSHAIDANSKYRMYVSGDTLVYDDIALIPHRYPNVDLALLHLGGTRILGVVKVTMDGADGVKMMQIVAPKRAIPIHYNDYGVFKSPLSDFQKAVAQAGLEARTTYLKHGETYQFQFRAPAQ